MRARLRLFTGYDDDTDTVTEPKVTMTFGELSRILADAIRTQRGWLADFADDEVQITEDLYDVLTRYSRLRPGA